MKKFLSSLLLLIYTVFFGTLFIHPKDTEADTLLYAPICPFGKDYEGTSYTKEELEADYKSFIDKLDDKIVGLNENGEDTGDIPCGEPNPAYGGTAFLDKGDCSDERKVVTELTEFVTNDVTLNANNKSISMYAGICCLTGKAKDTNGDEAEETYECYDTRNYYIKVQAPEGGSGLIATKAFDECKRYSIPGGCEKRQWIIGDSGIGIIKLVVKQLYTWGVVVVGIIAVTTLIIQGIRIQASGVSGDISDAKNKILQALFGIVLLFLSGILLYAVNPDFFGTP